MMKKTILLFIFILTCWQVGAQEGGVVVQTIKGKVINEATNEPVSYTNIGLEDTFYGTASDAEGNFELKIPAELVSKNIFFSAVGFKNHQFPVTELFDKEFNVIKLESQSYGIDDVDVAAQSKVLLRILRMASENTPYNFIGGPFNLVCDYENSKTIDDTIQVNQKANVILFDKNGYTNPSKLDAYKSIKYSVKKDSETVEDYRFSTGTTQIDELLEFDWVRSASSVLNPALLNDFRLTLEDEPEINGKLCWVISFNQSIPTLAGSGDFYAHSFTGKITVDKEDYSIKQIEGHILSGKNSFQGKSLAVSTSSIKVLENVSYDFTINYSNLKPENILLNKKYLSEGRNVSEQSRLVINQVQTTNLTTLRSREYFTGSN